MTDRWHVWIDDGASHHRAFDDLPSAERHARALALGGKPVEITDDDHNTVAYARRDALGHVWIDAASAAVL